MVLLRKEGWKEVKISVFSQVQVRKVAPTPQDPIQNQRLNYNSIAIRRDYGMRMKWANTNIWKELVGK